jgi:RNA polymerase sigma factor (sigma-70 family)
MMVAVTDDLAAVTPAETELEFDEAFERLAVLAYRVAARVLGHAGDAENIAAETLARAEVRWTRVRDHAEPWVVTVAGRLAVRDARRRQRVLPALGRPEASVEDRVADRVTLASGLRKLPRRQRQVLILRYCADLTEQQAAEVLGCSVSSLRTHARRGLHALRVQLAEPPAWLADRDEQDKP